MCNDVRSWPRVWLLWKVISFSSSLQTYISREEFAEVKLLLFLPTNI